MITIQEELGNSLTIEASGRLNEDDYRALVPRLERVIENHGKLRLLILLHDFKGWTPKALVDDLRFDVRHRKDFEQVAVVGEHRLEEMVTRISAPFFSGEMRFFEDEAQARDWLGNTR